MNYIVFDLEWNQPWNKPAPGTLGNEVIQIGAVKVDESAKPVAEFDRMIRPVHHKKLHPYVKKLTGLRSADVARGGSFHEAVSDFRAWCGEEACFVTWGGEDVPVLKNHLSFCGLADDWLDPWIDLQRIFASQAGLGRQQKSLQFALEYFGMEQEKTFHDACNDARYTAQIMARLDMARGLAEYESLIAPEPKPGLRVMKTLTGLATRRDALRHEEVSQMLCPDCGALLDESRPWLSQPGRRYMRVVRCGEHGEFLERLKMTKTADGCLDATAMLFDAQEESLALYDRRAASRDEKRRARRANRPKPEQPRQ